MKMTPLLCRLVSVWLCVAVVCWHPHCYVGCTESHQEAQRPVSSQDVSSDEDSGETSVHHKDEESWTLPDQSLPDQSIPDQSLPDQSLPDQSLSENEQLMEGEHQPEEQKAQELDQQPSAQAVEAEEAAAEGELEAEEGNLQPQQISEYQLPEVLVSPDEDCGPLLPSPDAVSDFAAENKDEPSILHLQDNFPNSVVDDASDVAAAEVRDSELPPADCEEEGEESNPYDSDSSPPVVVENTSNAHTAGTKTHSDPPALSPAHSSQHLEANTSHMLKEQDVSSPVSTDTDSSGSSKDPEDIPTFDEWKRKEVEKEKTLSTHTSNNGGSHTVKKVQKNFNNYASVECGAKILGANPEAKSTSAILKENMDLYMLNPCSNKIWFIIELCEPIQVKQLDIANFELFSSTPKDFLVSISDRYPTNKWLKLGTFHARDERTVQSFPLDEHLYAKYVKMFTKYIKVELVSHFGSEHFCPLSLIRVFGTSMVEEYEEIADPPERPEDQDDDLDYPAGFAPNEVKLSKNLIGSAKDAIMNMVNNIAVNVLGGGSELQGNISSQDVNMTEASQQLDSTSADLPSVPHTEDVQLSPDVPETVAPSSETTVTEAHTTPDSGDGERPPVEEEKVVTPLDKEEEEPISSTITLLDKEEELDEDKVNRDRHEENLNYCSLVPLLSSCSCAASLQEYLQRQCSASLSKKRKCQTTERKQVSAPIPTPSWLRPVPPSACPEPQQHLTDVHQPHQTEQAPEQEPEREAIPSGAAEAPGNTSQSRTEPALLEPSQTLNLPTPSATHSSSAKHTPAVETSQLSSEEPVMEPGLDESQDALAEERHVEPAASLSSMSVNPGVSAAVDEPSVALMEEKLVSDGSDSEVHTPTQTHTRTEQSSVLLPTTSPDVDHHPEPPVVPESSSAATGESQPPLETVTEPESSTDTKMEDLSEDMSTRPSAPTPPPPTSASLSDIYADPTNGTEQNGNPVHGSSQKESVFMRLNNRIKALEMNMSLSGRYLEQLSQRYRKQMEEMQKAFNKTIIKLQNTSRIAEEQDQRQTESIQLLQGQLENVTQLVLNLSVRVSHLQSEVSDRQNYLLLSLLLCLCLGLLLFANHCRVSALPPTGEPEPPIPKSYTHCCPDRLLSSCDDPGLKRSASYPLIHSESFQLATTEGPERLHPEETQSLCPANRKRRRRRLKLVEKVETLKPSLHAAPELCNGAAVCNGGPVTTKPTPLTKRLLHPVFRDSPSEGSSEGSSHSDDPSFCGITAGCSRICDGLPAPKTRAEKRALRRRRPKPSCTVVDLLHAPRGDSGEPSPISTIHDIIKRKTEQSSGTFVTLSGPA